MKKLNLCLSPSSVGTYTSGLSTCCLGLHLWVWTGLRVGRYRNCILDQRRKSVILWIKFIRKGRVTGFRWEWCNIGTITQQRFRVLLDILNEFLKSISLEKKLYHSQTTFGGFYNYRENIVIQIRPTNTTQEKIIRQQFRSI